MAQETQSEPTVSGLQEQLKALQTDYREQLTSRYGLDPVSASVIPLGTAKEMDNHAQLIQQAIKATQPAIATGGEASSRILPPVDAMLASKYKGPNGKG